MKAPHSGSDSANQMTRIASLCDRLHLPPPEAGADLDEFESLLRYLAAIDGEPTTTHAHQLIADGIELPPPDSLNGSDLHAKLWEVIRGLAGHRTYLYSTNHLSDAELYHLLWTETLNEDTYELDDGMGDCACHIDLTGDGSEESIRLYLQYYANDADRDNWQRAFPGDKLPPRLDPPHDRDRHLPQRRPSGQPDS